MKTHYKILIIISALLLLFGSFQIWTWDYLEFRKQQLLDIYRICSITFYLTTTIIIYYLLPENYLRKTLQYIGAVAILVSLLVFGATTFLGIPDNGEINEDFKVLLENKSNPNLKIILQCYRTGFHGDQLKFDTVVCRQLTQNIRWTRQFIDKDFQRASWLDPNALEGR